MHRHGTIMQLSTVKICSISFYFSLRQTAEDLANKEKLFATIFFSAVVVVIDQYANDDLK